MNTSGPEKQALAVALLACLFIVLATISRYGYNPSALISMSEGTATSHPDLLGRGIVVMQNTAGYDGQFYYLTAQVPLDPLLQRREYTDMVGYSRIGYPLVAAALALGQRDLLPYSLILVNLLAILGGMYLLQRLLRPLGQSPWLSLLMGVNSGNLISVQQDLTDALALTLGVGALFCYLHRRLGWATGLLAAAFLTRESAVLFWITLVAWEVGQRRWRGALGLLLALPPYALYQLYLWATLGKVGILDSSARVMAPLSGLASVVQRVLSISSAEEAKHSLSIALVMVLVVLALAYSLRVLAQRPHLFTLGVLVQALFAISASYGIWEGYVSAGKTFAGIYPFLILSYATRPETSSRALLALSALLSLLTLIRPFFTPVGPYYVT